MGSIFCFGVGDILGRGEDCGKLESLFFLKVGDCFSDLGDCSLEFLEFLIFLEKVRNFNF